MSFRHDAISKLYPEVVTSVDDKSYNSSGELVNVDEDAVAVKTAELQAEYDAKQYQRDREVAYPSIQEQLDMQYHDAINGTTTWKDAIAKVKTDNPKPSE